MAAGLQAERTSQIYSYGCWAASREKQARYIAIAAGFKQREQARYIAMAAGLQAERTSQIYSYGCWVASKENKLDI